MKFPLILAFAAATLFAATCSEPLNEATEEAAPQNRVVETSDNIVPGEGPIVLGDKLPNPYSMENMRKAIAKLQSRGLSKPALSTDIKPTHYYMRFKPKNKAEVDAVEADDGRHGTRNRFAIQELETKGQSNLLRQLTQQDNTIGRCSCTHRKVFHWTSMLYKCQWRVLNA